MFVWREHIPAGAALFLVAVALQLGAATTHAQTPVPTTPPASITPAPAGTPWPPPTGVTLRGYSVLLDAQNFPLPPDQQKHYLGIEWPVLQGFTGTYEVQRAVRNSASDPLGWGPVSSGPFAASAAVNGRIGFEELISFADRSKENCYRVRTVINGETGPYSEPVCSPIPPSSGPGPGASATAAPLPPAVGNAPEPSDGPSAGGIALILAAAAGLVALIGIQANVRR